MTGYEIQRTVQERFEEFHRENPTVYALLIRFAREVQAAGHRHYGIASLFERIRWHVLIETRDSRGFKLNNDFRSRYARKLMDEYPEFEGFFHTRELKAP